jgi:hypothetical protein
MSKNIETVQRYASDMLSAVGQIHEAVDRQKSDQQVIRKLEVHELLQKTSQILDGQIAALQRRLVELGGESGSSVKEVVASTLGQAAGIIGMVRPDKVSLMLRDDYTALNMAAIGYSMLHATALSMKDEGTADQALQHLKQLTPLIVEFNEITPRIVVEELVDEGDNIDMTTIPQAIINTQEAWRGEHIHEGHSHPWEEPPQDSASNI